MKKKRSRHYHNVKRKNQFQFQENSWNRKVKWWLGNSGYFRRNARQTYNYVHYLSWVIDHNYLIAIIIELISKFSLFEHILSLIPCYHFSLHRIENNVSVVAMDSHPKRTNGFLTGCLQSVLSNNVYARPFIEELPR